MNFLTTLVALVPILAVLLLLVVLRPPVMALSIVWIICGAILLLRTLANSKPGLSSARRHHRPDACELDVMTAQIAGEAPPG